MKILSMEQIRAADAYTIKNEPVASIDLMERAATAFVKWFIKNFPAGKNIYIFCGLGNNGGDGLSIARLLSQRKYSIEVFIVRYSGNCSKDFLINEKRLKQLKQIQIQNIDSVSSINLQTSNTKLIIIDAIFGSGINRPADGLAKTVIQEINKSKNQIIAVDIPSGMFSDKVNQQSQTVIKANHSVTFELPKLSFFFPENYKYVGEWEIVPIGLDKKFIEQQTTNNYYVTENEIRKILKPRKKFNHKGTFGHALIIAGSYGKMGAAILSSGACLRAGTGLVTVHIPKCGYQILQRSLPEAMVSIDKSRKTISTVPSLEKYSAIGIGPGIGTQIPTQKFLLKILKSVKLPLILDADAINILGENKNWLKIIPPKTILTPHPKEFERLAGKTKNDEERYQKQIDFAKRHNVYLILKTAHTRIATPEGKCFFNSTGNPGMATAGSGDVLTGILSGLLAQGYSPEQTCILGVYLHGLAGDIAAKKKSQQAMIASDIIENLGESFKILNR